MADDAIEAAVDAAMWWPAYVPYVPVRRRASGAGASRCVTDPSRRSGPRSSRRSASRRHPRARAHRARGPARSGSGCSRPACATPTCTCATASGTGRRPSSWATRAPGSSRRSDRGSRRRRSGSSWRSPGSSRAGRAGRAGAGSRGLCPDSPSYRHTLLDGTTAFRGDDGPGSDPVVLRDRHDGRGERRPGRGRDPRPGRHRPGRGRAHRLLRDDRRRGRAQDRGRARRIDRRGHRPRRCRPVVRHGRGRCRGVAGRGHRSRGGQAGCGRDRSGPRTRSSPTTMPPPRSAPCARPDRRRPGLRVRGHRPDGHGRAGHRSPAARRHGRAGRHDPARTRGPSSRSIPFVDGSRRILGSNYGSADPAVDFPRYAEWTLDGRLPVERLIDRRIALDDVEDAFAAMRRGALHPPGHRPLLSPRPSVRCVHDRSGVARCDVKRDWAGSRRPRRPG